MITTAEYLREKKLKEEAQARVAELEAEIAAMKQPQGEVLDVLHTPPTSEDAPE